MNVTDLAAMIEAILFVANGAVSVENLRKTLEVEPEVIQEALSALAEERAGSGVRLQRKGGEVQMVTAPEAGPLIERFLGIQVSGRLSAAALETLAIIAYREPITRIQIEAIRGVNSDGVLGTLLAHGLIAEAGRLETVGHPILYTTTFQFLQQFGLKSVDELPAFEEQIPMAKVWKPPAPVPDELVSALADMPAFIVQALCNRGLTSEMDIRRFLSAGAGVALHDPFSLLDMDVAVQRIRLAIERGESVAVYGDFDVDGICSAALLVRALQGQGARPRVYIPHRVLEGYGLNKSAITKLADDGVTLLLTADCGTSSVGEISHAQSLGMDVIVTDHHRVPEHLPPALAILNPHRAGSAYPFADLAGVGVAYKLACALQAGAPGATAVQEDLDLVALGTVVDVAPLRGENRALVRLGLASMRSSPRPGLKALMDVARIKPEAVDSGSLGMVLGPRLNAAGRLDTAKTSYDLLLSSSAEEAKPLADRLNDQNLERQLLLEEALTSARVEAAEQVKDGLLIFVSSASYRAGIVGLVAGRLAEEFYRPAIAVEIGDGISRGSCRSIAEFDIALALDECRELLERHGGHAQAAGFTVKTGLLALLQERLAAVAQRELMGQALEPTIQVDSVLPLSQATWQSLAWVKRMAPFGVGNPAPVLQSNGVRVRSTWPLKNGHLRLTVTDGRVTWSAIAFRQGEWAEKLHVGDAVDILYNLEENTWNGERSLQLDIKDLRRAAK